MHYFSQIINYCHQLSIKINKKQYFYYFINQVPAKTFISILRLHPPSFAISSMPITIF